MPSEEIPLSKPSLTEMEIDAVVRVLRSGRLSIGPVQERFEARFAEITGCNHAVACSSGTAALHMALLAHGVGPGDEVITTPMAFIAPANAILYVGATPVFVDIDPVSMNMDPALVENAITERTKAIIAVENFGNPMHMDAYRAIADKHEIRLIEDSCEGLGGRHKGRAIGAFGHCGVFGFYPNKQITTGEGGMLVTDDGRIADLCRSMRNQGRAIGQAGHAPGSWLFHERLGFNYRMTEIQAAIGEVQMRRLPELMEARQRVADMYVRRLVDCKHLVLPTVNADTLMSWFVFVVRLNDTYTRADRDRIIEGMHRHEVGSAPYFPCIHLQPFYRERFGFKEDMFPIAESISQRTLALPFFPGMSERDVDFAASTLELMISRENLRRG
ncbi:MAG: DegT/DnrJ/EryC1/StrS family aminotransferase [Phycisphaerales bacterium]